MLRTGYFLKIAKINQKTYFSTRTYTLLFHSYPKKEKIAYTCRGSQLDSFLFVLSQPCIQLRLLPNLTHLKLLITKERWLTTPYIVLTTTLNMIICHTSGFSNIPDKTKQDLFLYFLKCLNVYIVSICVFFLRAHLIWSLALLGVPQPSCLVFVTCSNVFFFLSYSSIVIMVKAIK